MLFEKNEVKKEYYRTGKNGSFLQVELENGEIKEFDSVSEKVNISAIVQSYGGYTEMEEERSYEIAEEPIEGDWSDEKIREYVGE